MLRRHSPSALVMQPNTQKSHQIATELKDLYLRHGPQLRVFLEKQLRLRHRVEDLLHDVFECLLRYPPAEQLRRADSYLWRIAWRLVNEANRRVAADRDQLVKAAGGAGGWTLGQSSTLAPEDITEWLAYREQARRCLEQLTPEERKAVILARFGCSYKEIAARMEITPEEVRKHLRQGAHILSLSAADSDEE